MSAESSSWRASTGAPIVHTQDARIAKGIHQSEVHSNSPSRLSHRFRRGLQRSEHHPNSLTWSRIPPLLLQALGCNKKTRTLPNPQKELIDTVQRTVTISVSWSHAYDYMDFTIFHPINARELVVSVHGCTAVCLSSFSIPQDILFFFFIAQLSDCQRYPLIELHDRLYLCSSLESS
jgi:hypothetical protein